MERYDKPDPVNLGSGRRDQHPRSDLEDTRDGRVRGPRRVGREQARRPAAAKARHVARTERSSASSRRRRSTSGCAGRSTGSRRTAACWTDDGPEAAVQACPTTSPSLSSPISRWLPLWLVLWLGIPLAVWLEDRGPVFFRQRRVGKNGKEFVFLKFRTMVQDAESSGLVTADADPRVTRVGRVLRRTALDELPQVINVLRGDMSFVGPRALPVQMHLDAVAEEPRFDQRTAGHAGHDGHGAALSAQALLAAQASRLRYAIRETGKPVARRGADATGSLEHADRKLGHRPPQAGGPGGPRCGGMTVCEY